MSGSAAVVIEGLSKRFKSALALDRLTATIRAGQITGLVGPDGAGKTTLMRLMAGLLLPSEGRIAVYGFDTCNEAQQIQDILGYMPQKFGLYEDLTVQENLELYARLRGLEDAEKARSFERMLAFTALGPFTTRLAGRLSGGMKQKLGLACALLARPKLLLLDEPSVGVDPVSRRELWAMVKEMVGEEMAVVWSTAYLDEAERCDEVLLLSEGRLLFSGPPGELTRAAEGRTYLLKSDPAQRRQRLTELRRREEVRDVVIQGDHIRLLLAPDAAPLADDWRPVPPRFEDAFIDRLGGSHSVSALAAHLPPKEKSGPPPIQARQLTKCFGEFTAARQVDFEIKRGEIFGLLGPNGAGKSTVFKMLCGLLKPTSGTALVSGFDLKTASSQARARIGYMAQKFSLYGELNVRQNLHFFSGVYGLTGQAQREKIAQMVEIFDLAPHLEDNAGLLPLGFKQRLALACAIMHDPDVLFLDEPTSGVDPLTRREFWMHINAMVEKGVTVMVTTHFMDEAEYCDRIALIYRGESIAEGPPDELKRRVRSHALPDPTLEDAFIALIRQSDALKGERAA